MGSEEAAADSLKDGNFMSIQHVNKKQDLQNYSALVGRQKQLTEFTIPELAEMLEKAKAEKAKTVIPKFTIGQYVNWIGYSDHCGEIEDIEISISDDGEPTITYFVSGVGQYWESELELSRK